MWQVRRPRATRRPRRRRSPTRPWPAAADPIAMSKPVCSKWSGATAAKWAIARSMWSASSASPRAAEVLAPATRGSARARADALGRTNDRSRRATTASQGCARRRARARATPPSRSSPVSSRASRSRRRTSSTRSATRSAPRRAAIRSTVGGNSDAKRRDTGTGKCSRVNHQTPGPGGSHFILVAVLRFAWPAPARYRSTIGARAPGGALRRPQSCICCAR